MPPTLALGPNRHCASVEAAVARTTRCRAHEGTLEVGRSISGKPMLQSRINRHGRELVVTLECAHVLPVCITLRVLCRLVPYLVGSVLDCFRPVIDFAVPPSHPDLHTAAVAAFMMSTCALQHYALHFLAEARALQLSVDNKPFKSLEEPQLFTRKFTGKLYDVSTLPPCLRPCKSSWPTS